MVERRLWSARARFVGAAAVLSVVVACGSGASQPAADEEAAIADDGTATTEEAEDEADLAVDDGGASAGDEAIEPATPDDGEDAASAVPHVSEYDGQLPGGRIVFTSDRGEDSDLWLVQPDGSELRQLTSAEHADWQGHWSPDGATIVFASQRAAFGPDGYIGDTPGGLQPYGLYLVDVEGGGTTHLLGGWEERSTGGRPGAGRAFNTNPQWSPDGARIAFSSDARGDQGIYVLAATAGSEVQRLTDPSLEAYYPTWSPDGTRLAFSGRTEPDGDLDLMVVTADGADGADARSLVDDDADERMPAWSPDGSTIVFVSDRGGSGDLYLLDLASGEVTALLLTDDDLRYPSWSPEGDWVVFESRVDRDTEVELVRADGTDRLRLTDDPALDGFPSWGR